MEDLILKRIGGLIAAHSGIYVREQDYQALADKLWQRIRNLGLKSLEDYYALLWKELEAGVGAATAGDSRLPLSPGSEWQELYAVLTVNESYFFRDKNQFRLLTETLLPDIIKMKQAHRQPSADNAPSGSQTGKPRLRIWSAGCSTGEELYSIAIMLEEMKFPWPQWDVFLIGTDISKTAIETAKKGVYSQWSFRQVPVDLQQKYFYRHHQLFQVNDSIRRKVKFVCGNLLKDTFPWAGGDLWNMDLILCRNVFIYLDAPAIGAIIEKFHDTLTPQGYLVTGHTELYGQDTSQFQVMSFPESVVYRPRAWVATSPTATVVNQDNARKSHLAVLPKKQPGLSQRSPVSLTSKVAKTNASARSADWRDQRLPLQQPVQLQEALKTAECLLRQEAYNQAIVNAEKIFSTYPQCDAAVKIAAHAYANIGRHEKAKMLCQRVLKRHPLSVEMYYLLAQIAEEQNQLEMTKDYLRKIIYLDASFVRAYLDLASIYEREKQTAKTQKMRAYALLLLDKLSPDAVLDEHTGTTVQEWKEHLQGLG